MMTQPGGLIFPVACWWRLVSAQTRQRTGVAHHRKEVGSVELCSEHRLGDEAILEQRRLASGASIPS